jgi:ubiquinone/menaquinone biosynthesis C-methylase UbiE
MKKLIKSLCPPIIWTRMASLKRSQPANRLVKYVEISLQFQNLENPEMQDLDLYWTPAMAKILDEWGTESVWNEIQLLLSCCKGKVLDIACGTGKTMELLRKFTDVEIYGCDISDLLIQKGIERGIDPEKLLICDATCTSYFDNQFDYSFSIGSLEHFTLEGIDAFIKESHRITSKVSFHMIPTSRSQINEGWMKTIQSFFNNSDEWWMAKYKRYYKKVEMVNSKWSDDISFGRWFICYK